MMARRGGPGTLRATERLHVRAALAALLRRVLGRSRADPDHVLAGEDHGRHDSVRHRALAARHSWPHAPRPHGALHRGGLAGPPPRHPRPSDRRRRPRRHLTSALRPRRRRRVLRSVGADRAAGRICLCAPSGGVLRALLLPEELRPAQRALAAARPGDRRPHLPEPRSGVLAHRQAGPRRPSLKRRGLGAFPRNLRALLPRLAESDGDRLFAALGLAAPATVELAALVSVHRALHCLPRSPSVLPSHERLLLQARAYAHAFTEVSCKGHARGRTTLNS